MFTSALPLFFILFELFSLVLSGPVQINRDCQVGTKKVAEDVLFPMRSVDRRDAPALEPLLQMRETSHLLSNSLETRSSMRNQNGQDAISLNNLFAESSQPLPGGCLQGENMCSGGSLAKCVNGKFAPPQNCPSGQICGALPLVKTRGTVVQCATASNIKNQISAALLS